MVPLRAVAEVSLVICKWWQAVRSPRAVQIRSMISHLTHFSSDSKGHSKLFVPQKSVSASNTVTAPAPTWTQSCGPKNVLEIHFEGKVCQKKRVIDKTGSKWIVTERNVWTWNLCWNYHTDPSSFMESWLHGCPYLLLGKTRKTKRERGSSFSWIISSSSPSLSLKPPAYLHCLRGITRLIITAKYKISSCQLLVKPYFSRNRLRKRRTCPISR